jgi:hypothetical protein
VCRTNLRISSHSSEVSKLQLKQSWKSIHKYSHRIFCISLGSIFIHSASIQAVVSEVCFTPRSSTQIDSP